MGMMIPMKYPSLARPTSLELSMLYGQLAIPGYRKVKLISRSAPIVLSDDEPESGPSSYEDEDEPMSRLPDILDLLRSDPPDFDTPKSSRVRVKVKVKVDRKGKGKEKVPLDILDVEVRKRQRSRSPDALVEMGNHYLVEGLSKRVEGRKRARSPITVSTLYELD
jgi:hypothetical protein